MTVTANQAGDGSIKPHPKISREHQQRRACIYVRQSTLKQVQHNQESQPYQYRLKQRALELGWSAERIEIIDIDLGRSGREAESRDGFQALVGAVSLGQVGIVFGYEVSRLARNNRDWYHLLDLAAMFGTLIADNDGVYDPRLYNDRLLLGLKGTMSEAELHLLRQRLEQGRLSQVKRGAYRQHLPTGLIRLVDGTVVKDPDDQVREVIELTLSKFAELGSINKVIRYLRQQKILLPRRQTSGPQAHQTLWKVASEAAVTDMMHNPAYAGAFAHGRKQRDPSRARPDRPAAGRVRKPMDEWLHLQHDVYPAYISWAQYLANQERLSQNGLPFTENREKAQGIARKGPGILQGMIVCGHCGHHLQTVYKHTPRYQCRGLVRTSDAPSDCNSVRAPVVDAVVVEAFFEAIQPAQLDALAAILASQQQDRQQLERQWQQQLKRVQYEVTLAQRQYDAVDPDNRLVAAELERRWEETLLRLRQTEEDYQHFQQTVWPDTIPDALCGPFQHISQHLPDLWPQLDNVAKKELLRSLISHVIVKRPVPDRIELRIVWISGHYTDRTTLTPIHRDQDVSGYAQMTARIGQLYQRHNDQQMAQILSDEGFHSARSPHVTPATVLKIRLAQRWFLPWGQMQRTEALDGYLTVRGLAKRLAVTSGILYRLIHKQVIPAEYLKREPRSGVYLIRDDDALIARLAQRIRENKRNHGSPKQTGGSHG